MDKDFYFLITIHFHQPVGNFDYVIERACKRCYEPFLDTIAGFNDIKFNLHYSGCLLEWFKLHRPDILGKIKKLVKAGQVELLGGGFYEPILSVLPSQDSAEQIKMLSQFIKDEFGSSVRGAWLPERVWEPQLAKTFSTAGIQYTIVDDTHLRYSGLNQSQLYGYYITEDDNACLGIFPSDKQLRYSIPFRLPHEAMDYLRRVKDEYGKNCVLYGDDGEKFGEWPGTEKWVYEERWLYNFLNVLKENSLWVKTAKISDYMGKQPPQGRIYLPTASYQEMSEWALPAEAAERLQDVLEELKQNNSLDRYVDFIRGGFWRNFFVKYPESNNMHKRMLLASRRLRQVQLKHKTESSKLEDAKRELFRAQCNCAYWHGIFGGLYLYHLRSAIYKHIISSDRVMDSIEHKDKGWIEIEEKDFDSNGHNEFIVNTGRNTFIIDTEQGAAIREWDIKSKSLNIVNTLSRKKEAYHRKLKQPAALIPGDNSPATIHEINFSNTAVASKQLYYDRHPRILFIDHFLPAKIDLNEVSSCAYEELGDFINAGAAETKYNTKVRPYLETSRDGCIKQQPVRLVKRFNFYPDKDKISITYSITNLSPRQLTVNFSPELNFSLTQDDIEKELSNQDSLTLHDKIENLRVDIAFSEKAHKIFKFYIYTVSQSEKDIEENYQASCVMPVFNIRLGKDKEKTISLDVEVKPL